MSIRNLLTAILLIPSALFPLSEDGLAQSGYIVEKIKHNYEILVEPQRKEIYNGEQTIVTIDVHEFDTAGQKIQAFRAAVVISITGLIDGNVTPPSGSKIITDLSGITWLKYKAGEMDKEISVMATFIPEGSAIEYVDEATITVKPPRYEATLTLHGSSTNTVRSSYSRKQTDGIEKGSYALDERSEASFYVPLKLENSGDMPILNQRWEYYRPLDINLTSFISFYRSKKYDYADHAGFGFEQTVLVNRNPVKRQIPEKDYLLRSDIILVIEKRTDKVVKIVTGGFPVEFYLDETRRTTGKRWNPNGSKPIENFDHKTDDISTTFTPGPVEDPVPDPTIKSVAESLRTYLKTLGKPLPVNIEIPEDESQKAETAPDLLVGYGDGKTFFGGKGNKKIDYSEGTDINHIEMTFNWCVARKKKPL